MGPDSVGMADTNFFALVLAIAIVLIAFVLVLVTSWVRQDVLQAIKLLKADVERAQSCDHKERLIFQQHMERLQDHVARGVQLLAKDCERTNNDGNDGRDDGDDHRMTSRLH